MYSRTTTGMTLLIGVHHTLVFRHYFHLYTSDLVRGGSFEYWKCYYVNAKSNLAFTEYLIKVESQVELICRIMRLIEFMIGSALTAEARWVKYGIIRDYKTDPPFEREYVWTIWELSVIWLDDMRIIRDMIRVHVWCDYENYPWYDTGTRLVRLRELSVIWYTGARLVRLR